MLHHVAGQRKTEKRGESTLTEEEVAAAAVLEAELSLDHATGQKKERRPSTCSSDVEYGCMGKRNKKKGGYKRFGEKKEGDDNNKKLTTRQWLLLTTLSLATLTSSFAICLFPPFFPQVVSKKTI